MKEQGEVENFGKYWDMSIIHSFRLFL